MKKSLLRKNRKAFTLIELLVTMTIMCIVVVMIGGMAEYTAGRLKSAQLTQVNDALRSALDTIGQKMYNANGHVKIGTTDIYGFRYYDSTQPTVLPTVSNGIIPDMLLIVSSTDTSVNTCTFFGLDTTKHQLMMDQDSPCLNSFKALANLTHPVTPSKVFVKTFDIVTSNSNTMVSTPPPPYNDIPRVAISLSGYDMSDKAGVAGIAGAVAKVESTFTMDGENVNYFNQL